MIYFEISLRDECGHIFDTYVWADSKEIAIDQMCEEYPESQVINITSPQEAIDRQNRREELLKEKMYDD